MDVTGSPSHYGDRRLMALVTKRATVGWNGHWYVVVSEGIEMARFDRAEKKNAQDFANGFNAGLARGQR